MRALIGYIIWLLFIWFEVNRNFKLIEVLKERPNYLHSFLIRVFFGILSLVLIAPYGSDPFLELYDLVVQVLANPVVRIILNLAAIFYLIFDPWLNKKRGLRWNYKGTNSGPLDRLKLGSYYALKLLCLAVLIYSICGG